MSIAPLSWTSAIASCGGIGYLPAPGTCATFLVGIPSAYLITRIISVYCAPLTNIHPMALHSCLWLSIMLGTIGAARVLETGLDQRTLASDPQWIVIDEVIGLWCACAGLPCSWHTYLIGALLFRLFDISKWGPIGWLERLPGAAGILADDIGAGISARLIILLLVRLGIYSW